MIIVHLVRVTDGTICRYCTADPVRGFSCMYVLAASPVDSCVDVPIHLFHPPLHRVHARSPQSRSNLVVFVLGRNGHLMWGQGGALPILLRVEFWCFCTSHTPSTITNTHPSPSLCTRSLFYIHLNNKEPVSPHHRRLHHADGINEFLNQQHADGNHRPRFTLVGLLREKEHDAATMPLGKARSLESSTYEIEVVEANPSVTADTIISNPHATGDNVGEEGIADDAEPPLTLLLSGDSRGDFSLLAVNVTSNRVDGIVKKTGEDFMEVHQQTGESTIVTVAKDQGSPMDWGCGVEDSTAAGDPPMAGANPDKGDRARCHAAGDDHERSPEHRRHHHSHQPHVGDSLTSLQSDLGDNACASPLGRRVLSATGSTPNPYTYQVDIFIEIDKGLVDNNKNMTWAVNYVNALVTAASVIYEREVDTHCE